jgi:hypothetical protein
MRHVPLLSLALLAAFALTLTAAHPSFGDTRAAAPQCYDMSYSSTFSQPRPRSLTYDTAGGVRVRIETGSTPFSINATLPLTIGDEPNPHFDRLYALLMKGFDSNRLATICVDRAPADSSDPVQITSVTVGFVGTTAWIRRT